MRLFLFSALLFSFANTLLPPVLLAQKSGSTGGATHPAPPPATINPNSHPTRDDSEFDRNDATDRGLPRPPLKDAQAACFHWPLAPVQAAAVSVNEMKIPEKARQEFDQGCAAARKHSPDEAQKHLERALKTLPAFAEAWALLGQVQEEAGHAAEAAQSCTQARHADPNYLPAYLCLADIAARHEQWKEVVDLTDSAIALHPLRAPAAFYYNCLANFYLNQFDAAEKSGLRVIDDGTPEQKAHIHLLLAKVSEHKGDLASEADHLRNFLRLAPNDPDADSARHILSQIERDSGAAASDKPSSH